jgi:hypothetical protein
MTHPLQKQVFIRLGEILRDGTDDGCIGFYSSETD